VRPCRHRAHAGETTAVFLLEDSAATRADWPHAFRLTYTVTLTARALRVHLAVAHTGPASAAPFSFTSALHTYLAVHRIEDVRVTGFQHLSYTDKMRGSAQVRRG
jgi:glucose-6-phosphate 1-epimerase